MFQVYNGIKDIQNESSIPLHTDWLNMEILYY